MGVTAAAHGKKMLELGFTVDRVVHDYGDLCQAITDLAVDRDAPFSIREFRTLNRCLDNAIADAVNEFSYQRDALIARQQAYDVNERPGFLVHELRNSLGTATLAVSALEVGSLPMSGTTGSVLKRSLAALTTLIARTVDEVRLNHATAAEPELLSVASLVADAKNGAALQADLTGCTFVVRGACPHRRQGPLWRTGSRSCREDVHSFFPAQ